MSRPASKRKAEKPTKAPTAATGSSESTPSDTSSKRVKPTNSVFLVREVHKEMWSGFNESGVNARRRLVGIFSTAESANQAAVQRLYKSMHDDDFPDIDDDDRADVICGEHGPHGLLQLEIQHGEDPQYSLTVRVTEHVLDGDRSAVTKKQYEQRLGALRSRGETSKSVDVDDEE